jgi:hypothetical protein
LLFQWNWLVLMRLEQIPRNLSGLGNVTFGLK